MSCGVIEFTETQMCAMRKFLNYYKKLDEMKDKYLSLHLEMESRGSITSELLDKTEQRKEAFFRRDTKEYDRLTKRIKEQTQQYGEGQRIDEELEKSKDAFTLWNDIESERAKKYPADVTISKLYEYINSFIKTYDENHDCQNNEYSNRNRFTSFINGIKNMITQNKVKSATSSSYENFDVISKNYEYIQYFNEQYVKKISFLYNQTTIIEAKATDMPEPTPAAQLKELRKLRESLKPSEPISEPIKGSIGRNVA